MSTSLTPRENILRVYNCEMPEWVPVAEKSLAVSMPTCTGNWSRPRLEAGQIFYDPFKTPHIAGPDLRVAVLPIPGEPHVPDITQWRKYLEMPFPDPNAFDWSVDEENAKSFDRENKAVSVAVGGTGAGSPYNAMVKFLGHEGASIAMLTEPEAWHELINLLTDWEVAVIKRAIEVYKPDIICTSDDLGAAHGPFMSPETYRELIKPYQKRIVQAIVDGGCIAELHCCGKADLFVDDWYEIGIRSWNPAQVFNDLEAVKAKYGRKFVIDGGYDSQGRINRPGATEEEVRTAVRAMIDRLAPGGGFIFNTSGMALVHELGQEHYGWIIDEADTYSKTFYK